MMKAREEDGMSLVTQAAGLTLLGLLTFFVFFIADGVNQIAKSLKERR